jgi:plastocyanin
VASDQFSPAFLTVYQGDSIMLSVVIVNGDHHEMHLTDPDGESIIAKTTWDRGREYTAFFQAQKLGTYQLNCGTHAPSMTARILAPPRERSPA